MTHPRPTSQDPQDPDDAGLRRFLLRRTKIVLLLMFVAACGFIGLELATAPVLGPHTLVKLCGLATISLGLLVVRHPLALDYAVPLSILVVGVGYAGTVLSGALSPSQEYATSAIVLITASLAVGTVLPWGAGAQLVSVLIAVICLVAGVLAADGNLDIVWDDAGAAVVLALGSSVVLAREVRHTRREAAANDRQRRAAEGEIRAFNATLERRVFERTVALAEANRRLEEESDRARNRQDELAHVQRLHLVNEMAATMAHEFHQPLGAVANYAAGGAHRLRSGNFTPAEILAVLEKIAAEAVRAGDILRNVRRMASRKGHTMELVDVASAMIDAARMLESLARRHGVELRVELPPGARVIGDRSQLDQVFVNLLLNAIEATEQAPEGTRRVDVTATVTGTELRIRVKDTGPGIDDDAIEKLFTPFFTTKANGIGMGLAISRNITESHGGSLIALPHRSPGAEFLLSLPAVSHGVRQDALQGEPGVGVPEGGERPPAPSRRDPGT